MFFGNNFICVQVDYFDVIQQAVSILADSRLMDGFMTKPDVQYVDGVRIYGEMNTGTFWEGSQQNAPEVPFQKILFFCLFFF